MEKNNGGKAALIIFVAFGLLVILSLMPWSKWTGGKVKDFNLLADIFSAELVESDSTTTAAVEDIDPELLKAQSEAESAARPVNHADSASPSLTKIIAESDTLVPEAKPSKVGDLVVIEDYTPSGLGLANLRRAINSGAFARIALVGDSYIEGDIFSQDLRDKLQSAYGGEGVGYVNMHSDFPGFRRTVKQGGSGWKTFTALKKAENRFLSLSEQYAVAAGEASATYHGTKAYPQNAQWSRSKFLFITPEATKISYRAGGDWIESEVAPDSMVQMISIDGITDDFEVKTRSTKLMGLGVWLDGNTGIGLDCMSSRGFSGITLTRVNPRLCLEMTRCGIDYNLIILEFGINAMSSSQKNYSVYCSRMVEVINHVKQCYPRADILLMGVGDRGEKRGTEIHSMSTADAMIDAQREAARKAHCLFWDTREAMGGRDAVVSWSREGLINKDYIHLTHKGGERLAQQLFKAIQYNLK